MISKRSLSVLTAGAVLSVGLVACSGDSDSSSNPTISTTKTGTFIDAPVKGLGYKTATQSGFTDAQGHFKYKDGETIYFKLGNLPLGRGKAAAVVTPYTIADSNTTAANIALVLQNFDGNRSNAQILDLSKLKDYKFSVNELNMTTTPTDLENSVDSLLATADFQKLIDENRHDLITEDVVKNIMDDFIQKHEDNTSPDTNSTSGENDNATTEKPDLSGRNVIHIMHNVDLKYSNIFELGYKDYDKYTSQTVSSNVTCSSYGFDSSNPDIKVVSLPAFHQTTYTNKNDGSSCSETDYAQISGAKGTSDVIYAYYLQSIEDYYK